MKSSNKLKLLLAFALVLSILFCFTACKNKISNEKATSNINTSTSATTNTTAVSTTEMITENGSKTDKKKAQSLKKAVVKAVGTQENDEITVEDNGKFVYRNIRDASQVYALERSDDKEKEAKDKAEKIAKSLENYYGILKKGDENFVQVGNDENGIDSVSYNFYYASESGAEIRIQIDSDCTVSYIESGICF